MKKLICLFLGLAVVLSLAAGCDRTLGPEIETTKLVSDEERNQAAGQLGDLDDAAKQALDDMLARGVTLPAEELPVQPMAPPMPTGVQARPEDVYPLMEKVRNILSSDTYMFKARGSAPPSAGMPMGTTPVTFAVDKGKSAFEADMDWTNMMRAMAEPGTQEYNMARINGATMATLFGRKVRFVSRPDGDLVLFVDKKTYVQIPAGEGENGEGVLSMGSMFGEVFSPKKSAGDVQASKVTDNGKEYLCATIKGEGGVTMRYYFLVSEDSPLKRIEMDAPNPETGKNEVIVFEIDMLTDKVDAAMFSSAGFSVMPFDQMLGEAGGLGTMFGG